MAETPNLSRSLKEGFSGPRDVLELAHKIADPKGRFENSRWIPGESGAWSRWLCVAITEKLERDEPSALAALRGQVPTASEQLDAEILATAAEVGKPAALEALRKKLRTAAAGKKEAA